MSKVRLHVLGPLRIETDAGEVEVGGAKQRLLAALLASRGRDPISTDVLVDALWPSRRPADPEHALQNLVSRLRRLLGADRQPIPRGSAGYRLSTAVDLDVLRFHELVEEGAQAHGAGQHVAAFDLLMAAEALWRGRPFADVPDATLLSAEATRLQQLRRRQHDLRFDAALAAGRHAEVFDELGRRVADDPLDERRRGQLMVALVRSGRQAEALTAYDQGRALLRDELGVEPGPELRALQLRILRQSPDVLRPAPAGTASRTRSSAAAPPPRLPSPLAASSRQPMVGRQEHMSALMNMWREATSHAGRLVLLEGEAGAGKTRVLAALATQLQTAGAAVLFGRCDEQLRVPYQPFVEALGSLGDEGTTASGDASRRELFERVVGHLQQRTEDGPVLLVIDDLHWATAPTLLLLRHVVRWGATLPMLIAAGLRDRGSDPGERERALLAELLADPSVHRLAVGRLALDEVRELVMDAGRDPITATHVHQRTGGNAFLVRELLRGVGDPGDGQTPGHTEVPHRVAALVAARRARLSRDADRLVEYAAVVGELFDVAVIGPATGLDETALADALDEAIAAGFVERREEGARRYAFVHALVRDTVLHQLNAIRRSRLHGDVASSLEVAEHHRVEQVAAPLARHYAEAEVWSLALRYATLAGDVATRTYAWEDAVRHYRQAISISERTGDAAEPAELLLRLADAERRSANTAAALDIYIRAYDAARAAREREVAATAAIGFEDCRAEETFEDHAGASRRMLGVALDELDGADPDLETALLARLAVAEAQHGLTQEAAHDLARRALERARGSGRPALLAAALEASYWVNWTPEGLMHRLAVTEELTPVAARLDDRRVLRARVLRASASLEAGDREGFESALAGYEEDARRVSEPWYLWWIRAFDGTRAIVDGRLHDLHRVVTELSPNVQGRQQAEAVGLFSTVLALERGRQDGYPELIDGWTMVLQSGGAEVNHAHAGLALMMAVANDRDGAMRHLEQVSLRTLVARPSGTWGLACVALAAAELGAADTARDVLPLLEPYPRRVILIGMLTPFTTTSHILARLATTVDELPTAAEHARDAQACARALGAPMWVARATYHRADLLLRANHDAEAATSLAARARDEADALGMEGLRKDACVLLERASAHG